MPHEAHEAHQHAKAIMERLDAGELTAGVAMGQLLDILQHIEDQIRLFDSAKSYARACIANTLATSYDNKPLHAHGHTITYHESTSYTRVNVQAFRGLLAELDEGQPEIADRLRSCLQETARAGHVTIKRIEQRIAREDEDAPADTSE